MDRHERTEMLKRERRIYVISCFTISLYCVYKAFEVITAQEVVQINKLI